MLALGNRIRADVGRAERQIRPAAAPEARQTGSGQKSRSKLTRGYRNGDRTANASAYCSSCAFGIIAKVLKPFFGGRRHSHGALNPQGGRQFRSLVHH